MNIVSRLERLLRALLIESFLAKTAPVTRLAVAVLFSFCIFINGYFAMGVFTGLFLLIAATSLETIERNWVVFTLPVVVGAVLAGSSMLFPGSLQYLGVSPLILVWKLFNLCLAATVFLVLLPDRDLVLVVRQLPYPTLWVASISAFRSVEIGQWALHTVVRTRSSKRIRFFSHPVVWLDSVVTGVAGHYLEFLDGFTIALRTRGAESAVFTPRKPVPSFGALDLLTLLCLVVAFIASIK